MVHADSSKISRTAVLLLRLALLGAACIAVITGRWSVVFAGLGTFGLTFVPQVIAGKINLRLPLQFEFAITLFLYAALYLGEVVDYYHRFWWWDIGLHSFSAFAFGFAGFLILYLITARDKLRTSPFWIAIFSFTFALAIGAIWEIFEYGMDTFFGANMQKSGLRDTMGDLIVDTIGASVASFIGYIYLRFKIRDPFDLLINWFLQANPRLNPRLKFRKRRRS